MNQADVGLLAAARMGGREGIQKWLDRGASLHAVNRSGKTALMLCHNVATLHWLIAQGLDVDARDANRYTALFHAAAGHSTKVMRVLLEHGADPNLRCRFETPLMVAAYPWPEDEHSAETAEALRLLLDHGAEVNATDTRGKTALICLLADEQHKAGHLPIVRLLLDYGADTWREDADGNTATRISIRRGFSEVTRLLEHASVS